MAPESLPLSTGLDIFQKTDAAFVATFPALRRFPFSRGIAKEVLVPEIRTSLQDALASFEDLRGKAMGLPPATWEIPYLDREIRKSVGTNPVLGHWSNRDEVCSEFVSGVRAVVLSQFSEGFKEYALAQLAAHGVRDRNTLLWKGPRWFVRESFPPFGNGRDFATYVLGSRIHKREIHKPQYLGQIANVLGLPILSEDTARSCRKALAEKGIVDRRFLLFKGVGWFLGEHFPPFGSGNSFAKLLLGLSEPRMTVGHLGLVADTLGWPAPSPEQERAEWINALGRQGVRDRPSLLGFGSKRFKGTYFPPYGKGTAFVGRILGKTIGQGNDLTLAHLERVAEVLGFPRPSPEDQRQACVAALSAQAVTDRPSLVLMGTRRFTNSDFPPYGKGKAFAGLILGEKVKCVTLSHLERISDVLGFAKLSPEEKRRGYVAVLVFSGVADRRSLLAKGPVWFMETRFPPYGKGSAFASLILGGSIKNVTLAHLERIADDLGFRKPPPEEERQGYITALSAHGIQDRRSLLSKGVIGFTKAEFPPYGFGKALAHLILGEALRFITLKHLARIADVLFPEGDGVGS
jgi:hypothetical protein